MTIARVWIAIVIASIAAPLRAGPPYLTDDPVPTDTGHWEIYGFGAAEGRRSAVDVDAGVDLNYGLVENIQLTATLPMSFTHDQLDGWRGGAGDIEAGVKYRFVHDEPNGFSAAVFPRIILPTASHSPGEKARVLLPLWIGKDFTDGTSVFGGGGYLINPGPGNRNVWQAAVAVTHDVSKRFSIGAEVTRQSADVVGGTAQTRAGLGSIFQLTDHYALLLSGGPTWSDNRSGYHVYAALGINL